MFAPFATNSVVFTHPRYSMQQDTVPSSTSEKGLDIRHVDSSMTSPISSCSTSIHESFTSNSSANSSFFKSFSASPEACKAMPQTDLDALPPYILPKSSTPSHPTSPRTIIPYSPPNPTTINNGPFDGTTKASGLIRRLSRGAQNKLLSRPSTSNFRSRDQRSGPVTVRRSHSRDVNGRTYEASEFELHSGDELPINEGKFVRQWPMTEEWRPPRRPVVNVASDVLYSTPPSRVTISATFEKITKKKVKNLRFFLDKSAAKLCWSNVNAGLNKHIYVDDIKEIRACEHARNYLAEFGKTDDILPRWFTIVYSVSDKSKGRIIKHMHLVAPDEATHSEWTSTLWRLMWSRGNLVKGFAEHREASLQEYWQHAKDKRLGKSASNELMSFAEIKVLVAASISTSPITT